MPASMGFLVSEILGKVDHSQSESPPLPPIALEVILKLIYVNQLI